MRLMLLLLSTKHVIEPPSLWCVVFVVQSTLSTHVYYCVRTEYTYHAPCPLPLPHVASPEGWHMVLEAFIRTWDARWAGHALGETDRPPGAAEWLAHLLHRLGGVVPVGDSETG